MMTSRSFAPSSLRRTTLAILVAAATILCSLGFVSPGHAQPRFQLNWIANDTRAFDINNLGQVVGTSDLNGFVWTKAAGIKLLGGSIPVRPNSINESSLVAGSTSASSTDAERGAVWRPAQSNQPVHHIPLVNPSLGGEISAVDINDHGLVVGIWFPNGQASSAIVWDQANGVRTLATHTGGAFTLANAVAVNNLGEIAGTNAVWNPITGGRSLQSPQSGTLVNQPHNLNHQGDTVGWSFFGGTRHAVHWNPLGQPTLLNQILGSISDEAIGINEARQLVGFAHVTGGQKLAVYWDEHGNAFNLNNLLAPHTLADGSMLIDAYAINDLGQIAGTAQRPDGSFWSYALTPVPEPNALLMAALGAAGLCIRRRPLALFSL